METVNLSRAVLTCNVFHFCFAAAKASLIPFLTLFCRLMGLSATETGIIMAVKTATGFIWAPLWSRCAIAYNKRRTMLMFSIFIMAATYLSLSVVFTQVKDPVALCSKNDSLKDAIIVSKLPENASQDVKTTEKATIKPTNIAMTTVQPTTPELTTVLITQELATVVQKIKTTIAAKQEDTVTSGSKTFAEGTASEHKDQDNINDVSTAGEKANDDKDKVPSVDDTNYNGETPDDNEKVASVNGTNDDDESPLDVIRKMLATIGYPVSYIKENKMTPKQVFLLLNEEYKDTGLTFKLFKEFWDPLLYPEDYADTERVKRGVESTWKTLKGKMSDLMYEIEQRKMQVFVIVLVIVIFGEFFSSPVEKVADDSWFDFLDRVDVLEKYGKQRLAGSIAFILLPVAVTVAVDYTDCLLFFNIHHFLIHFYAYGVFLGFALFFAFFYPVPPPSKHKTKSKVMKGLQIVCCDCRGFLYVVTLLIMGITYASVHTFLFWVIQDKGGSETNMGLCVTIGAVAEIPMLMFTGKMVNKIGNAGVVSVALLAMTTRTLYYSFLEIPWAVLPIELTHAFTHTAMWYAVLSYEEFNVGPGIDRSIRSVLSSIYFGVGFSIGSLFSGVLYDLFGSSVMYWTGSALTGVWAIVFFLISLCLPKKEKIKYVRLLKSESEESDDADDWLEMALKEQ